MRVLDQYRDYSTTRGPMTSYEIVCCDSCSYMTMSRRAAQSTKVGAGASH